MNPTPSDWAQVEPLLDEAMAALDDTDRTAVLLRYFENKSLRDVGLALGTSDDTAQKRVSRAVDKLREFFAKRDVTVGASGLVVVISANAVQAAPAGLALTISAAAALAGTALATTAAVTTTKAIDMASMHKTLVSIVLAATVGTGIYEARQAAELRAQVHALQQQQVPLTDQIQQVQRQRDKALSQFTSSQREIEQLKRDAADIHRLRSEIGALRRVANEVESTRRSDGVVQAAIADLVPFPEPDAPKSPSDIIGPGQMWFTRASAEHGLRSYAHFSGEKLFVEKAVLKLPSLLNSDTTNSMTRAEALALLEQILRVQAGIVVTHLDTNVAVFRLQR